MVLTQRDIGDNFIIFLDKHIFGIYNNVVGSVGVAHIKKHDGSAFLVGVEVFSRVGCSNNIERIDESDHVLLFCFFYFLEVEVQNYFCLSVYHYYVLSHVDDALEFLGGVEGVAQFWGFSLIEVEFLKAELFLAIFEADQPNSSLFSFTLNHENDLEQLLSLLLPGHYLVLFLLLFAEGVLEGGVGIVRFEEEFIGEDVVHHEEPLVGYKFIEGLLFQKV